MIISLISGCASTFPRIPGPLGPVGAIKRVPEAVPAYVERERNKKKKREIERGFNDDSLLAATDYYLRHSPEDFPDDCSGFVCAIYGRVGIPLTGGTKQLWVKAENANAIHRRKRPKIGDLAFFDNTWDKNGNGDWDDELTHVALVIGTEPDGTILMAHGGTSAGRTKLVMNLEHPDELQANDGRKINDYLRRKNKKDPKDARRFASQLWRGFATLRRDEINLWLQTNDS